MTRYLVGGAKEYYIHLDGMLRPDPALLFVESMMIKLRYIKDFLEALGLLNTVHHDARADDHALRFMKTS
jgi:hypothetical protein